MTFNSDNVLAAQTLFFLFGFVSACGLVLLLMGVSYVVRTLSSCNKSDDAPPDAFQSRVHAWVLECFGRQCAMDLTERNLRFIEEALELVQACGLPRAQAHRMVDWAYERHSGEPFKEVGGVLVTLTALCTARGIDLERAAMSELNRVWKEKERIIAAHRRKIRSDQVLHSSKASSRVFNY